MFPSGWPRTATNTRTEGSSALVDLTVVHLLHCRDALHQFTRHGDLIQTPKNQTAGKLMVGQGSAALSTGERGGLMLRKGHSEEKSEEKIVCALSQVE